MIIGHLNNEANRANPPGSICPAIVRQRGGGLQLLSPEAFRVASQQAVHSGEPVDGGEADDLGSGDYVHALQRIRGAELQDELVARDFDAQVGYLREIQGSLHGKASAKGRKPPQLTPVQQRHLTKELNIPQLAINTALSGISKDSRMQLEEIDNCIVAKINHILVQRQLAMRSKSLSNPLPSTVAEMANLVYERTTAVLFQALSTPGKIFTKSACELIITKATLTMWSTNPFMESSERIDHIFAEMDTIRGRQTVSYAHGLLSDYEKGILGQYYQPLQYFAMADHTFGKVREILVNAPIAFHQMRNALRSLPMMDTLAGPLSEYWNLPYMSVTQEHYQSLKQKMCSIWSRESNITVDAQYQTPTRGSGSGNQLLGKAPVLTITASRAGVLQYGGRGPGQGPGRGHGRGRGGGRGGGRSDERGGRRRSRSTSATDGQAAGGSSATADPARVCYLCKQPGHIAKHCPQKSKYAGINQTDAEERNDESPEQTRPTKAARIELPNSTRLNASGRAFTVEVVPDTAGGADQSVVQQTSVSAAAAAGSSGKRQRHIGYGIVDSGAQAHISRHIGTEHSRLNGIVTWGDGSKTVATTQSKVPVDIHDGPAVSVDCWHVEKADSMLLSLSALLDTGAVAHFSKARRVVTFPCGTELELDKDFGFRYSTHAPPQLETRADHAEASEAPDRALGTPREIWERSHGDTHDQRLNHFMDLINEWKHAHEVLMVLDSKKRVKDALAVREAEAKIAAAQGNDAGQQ